jgi:PncC family amidohydrolase
MFDQNLITKATNILEIAKKKNIKLAFAESCTGGLLSALFTELPGSSEVIDCSFVTYSNAAKIKMIGVKKETLQEYGAVSEKVAQEMAIGALKNSQSDLALAITGIAGPDGGSKEKPIGLVYIGFAAKNKASAKKFIFLGERSDIRKSTLTEALKILETVIFN